MNKHNINELLEKKKELEKQIAEKQVIQAGELTYIKEKRIDHKTPKNNRDIIPRQKQTLVEFSQIYNGLVEELAKVKTAIQKYNAKMVLGKLQERESIRYKITYLNNLKNNVIREKRYGSKVLRQDNDGIALETAEVTEEPMFTREEVEKQVNQLAAQERKINTEIQKLNLEASITL